MCVLTFKISNFYVFQLMPRDEGIRIYRCVRVSDSWRSHLKAEWLNIWSGNKVKRSPTGEVLFHSSRGRRNRQKVCIADDTSINIMNYSVTVTQGRRVMTISGLQLSREMGAGHELHHKFMTCKMAPSLYDTDLTKATRRLRSP